MQTLHHYITPSSIEEKHAFILNKQQFDSPDFDLTFGSLAYFPDLVSLTVATSRNSVSCGEMGDVGYRT